METLSGMGKLYDLILFDFIECFTTTFLRAHSWLGKLYEIDARNTMELIVQRLHFHLQGRWRKIIQECLLDRTEDYPKDPCTGSILGESGQGVI